MPAYRQCIPEDLELDDYDIMEEEIYSRAFQDDRRVTTRCKEIFLLHLDGKKNEK